MYKHNLCLCRRDESEENSICCTGFTARRNLFIFFPSVMLMVPGYKLYYYYYYYYYICMYLIAWIYEISIKFRCFFFFLSFFIEPRFLSNLFACRFLSNFLSTQVLSKPHCFVVCFFFILDCLVFSPDVKQNLFYDLVLFSLMSWARNL